jgi:hypothetical protein
VAGPVFGSPLNLGAVTVTFLVSLFGASAPRLLDRLENVLPEVTLIAVFAPSRGAAKLEKLID